MIVVKHLRRIGNSQGVIIPKEMLEHLNWDADINVTLCSEDGRLYIDPNKKKTSNVQGIFDRD